MNDENLIPAKKGEVRNPNGKPKGCKNFKTIYKHFLKQKFKKSELEEITGFEIPFTDKEELTVQEAIVLRHIKKTMGKADYKDIGLIIDRVDGLLKQPFEHSGEFKYSDLTDEELQKKIKELNDKG
jgi:hypothetical protein